MQSVEVNSTLAVKFAKRKFYHCINFHQLEVIRSVLKVPINEDLSICLMLNEMSFLCILTLTFHHTFVYFILFFLLKFFFSFCCLFIYFICNKRLLFQDALIAFAFSFIFYCLRNKTHAMNTEIVDCSKNRLEKKIWKCFI